MLSYGGIPDINKTMTVKLGSAMPNKPTLLFLGLSKRNWSAIPLPLNLTPFGAPGCVLLCSGDLLLNVAFQVVLAEESGRFDRSSVAERLEGKMIRRHPHLFGFGEKEPWEVLKAKELGKDESVLNGLASGLDPLL